MKKRIVSSLLVLVMIFSAFAQFDIRAYGATTEPFSFEWSKGKKISDLISIVGRSDTNNELVLSWQYGEVNGNPYKATDDYYIMTYHLTNGEAIELKVNRASDAKTNIEYRVKNLASNTYKQANLLAYDEKSSKVYWQYYKDLSSGTTADSWRKVDSSTEVWHNSATGGVATPDNIFAPTGVTVSYTNDVAASVYGPNITLDKNTAVAFKYDNKLVTLKWDMTGSTTGDGKIYLGIEGIEKSKIYNFEIACKPNGNDTKTYINVMKLLDFEVKPVDFNGAAYVDKKTDPTNYGGKNTGLNIRFKVPEVWDDSSNKFVAKNYTDDRNYNGIMATVELKKSSKASDDAIQVKIPDVYDETKAVTVNSNTGDINQPVASIQTDVTGSKYYSFNLQGEGVKTSSLFTIATVSVQATATGTVSELSKLSTETATLDSGKNAYTYLEYDTETKGNGERVLKLKPYNVSGTYYVYKANATGDLPPVRTEFSVINSLIAKYDYLVSSGLDEIEIPIVNNGEPFYVIEFVYENGVIASQILLDNPDTAKYLVTPELKVKDYKIITETSGTTKTEKLRMVLSWSGGEVSVFDSLASAGKEVTYTFAKTPFSPREEKYSDFLKVYAYNDGGSYKLRVEPNAENNVRVYEGIWNGYQTLGKPEVVATNTDGTTDEVSEVVFTAVLEFDITKSDNLSSRNEPAQVFYYPSVYYMKMKGSYTNANNELKTTAYCNPVNVTLDEKSKTILPPPQNYTATNITSKSFDASWATVSDSVYGDFIETNNYRIDTSTYGAGVNIFITQKNVLSETDAAKQLSYFTNTANITTLKYSDISKKATDGTITLDVTSAMSDIRKGKMIKIAEVPQSVDLKTQVVKLIGLDKNTIYYTALQTLLNVINKTDNEPKQVVSDSVSQILTVTTKAEDELDNPDPDEVAPESPADFREDTEAEQSPTKTTLIWTEVEDTESISEINIKKEYELIRVDKKLDDTLLSKRNSFDKFWSEDLKSLTTTQKVAWQTDSTKASPNNLLYYNGTDFALDITKTQNKYIYEYEKRNPTLEFVDNTLMPNRIYYYYLRTVRMQEGTTGVYTEAAYSSWEPVTITTNPIKAPIDLKVERNTTYFSYDKEKEAVISFYAAIPVGTSTADIAALYPLEYSIMEDGGEWKTATMEVTNTSLFKVTNVTKNGYQQFVYKITGLTPGKGYSVKVRMKSRVNALTEATAVYDISLYSNTEQFRTDMNQDDYDTAEGIKKWLELFDDELMAISTKNYWVTNNSSSNYEAIYRTSTFDGELQKAVSGVYSFEASGQDKQVYYIPAKTLLNSNNANIGFKLINGDMEVLIRPNSIDANTTKAISDILGKIKDGTVKDYYIKIEANWSGAATKVNNSEALSDQIELKMSVVGSKEVEKALDAKYVGLFNKAISDTNTTSIRAELKQDLKAAIQDKDTNEELYKLVMDAVGEAYDDIIDDIEDDFDDNTKYNYAIDTLDENMLITASVNGQTTVAGYRKNSTAWEIVTTNNYGMKKGFETKILGVFVFAGNTVNIPDVAGITNASAAKDLIAKYGLDDYLGKDIINVDASATKYMVVGCVARIAGAPATQSETAYLKSKGVNVTSGRMYNEISNQEALYLVMSIYEIKTGTKVSAIKINNYNAVPNIESYNDNYKKSALAAAQLGIYTNTTLGANGNITVRTLLEYLGNLSKKIKL